MKAPTVSLSALECLARAKRSAQEWSPDTELLDVASAQILMKQVAHPFTRFAQVGYVLITPLALTQVQHLKDSGLLFENSMISTEPEVQLETPLVLGWRFIFKSSNRYLAVVATETGTTQWENAADPEIGVIPIKDWKIDSTQAIVAARAKGGIEKGQQVTLKMWLVSPPDEGPESGKLVPLWLVPFMVGNGDLLSVRADTGEIVNRRQVFSAKR